MADEATAMRERYTTLDGLRGVAAICVVMFHGKTWFGVVSPSNGYMAVDLFFALSGFVIAASYEHRFNYGMTPWEFLKARFIRLYPLYFVGFSCSVILLITELYLHSGISQQYRLDWYGLPFALLAIPSPFISDIGQFVYPLNFPSWSLFFEFFVNIAYMLTYRFWSFKVLILPILVAGTLLLLFGGNLDAGWSWRGFPIGFLRACFSFPIGVLIFKLRKSGYRATTVPGAIIILAFGLMVLIPANDAVLIAFVGSPLLVYCGCSAQPQNLTAFAFTTLGSISYALYAIHIPMIGLVLVLLGKTNLDQTLIWSDLCFWLRSFLFVSCLTACTTPRQTSSYPTNFAARRPAPGLAQARTGDDQSRSGRTVSHQARLALDGETRGRQSRNFRCRTGAGGPPGRPRRGDG